MIKGEMSADILVLLFLFFSLTVAIVIKQMQKVFSFIPYTPTLFVVSILFGKFSESLGVVGASIQSTAEIDPRGILLIFLPPLIFESSFNSDWYVFRKQSAQISILAFPSVLVGALIIMFGIKIVIGYDDSYYTYIQAFMFGSILSCTDTVAVLALLKEAGAPKKFSSLIEGQSLLNDGSCMILYTISLQLAKGGTMSVVSIIVFFLQLTLGAVVLGVIFGFTATEMIKLSRNDPILCFNITLVGCYLLYFTAEYVHLGIHISGIMALVSMGLYMAAFGRTKFSVEARERVHHVWKVFVFVAETVIFILGGVIVGTKSLNNPQLLDLVGTRQLIGLLILYLCMVCARFMAIGVFMFKLKKLGYGLKWAEVVALTYGGLRGAVGIAFTLILASNPLLPEKFRSICIFNMVGCAFLTLVINAPTCSKVIIALGLCKKSEIKVRLFNNFMQQCVADLSQNIKTLENNPYLERANWTNAAELAGLSELKHQLPGKQSIYTDRENASMNRGLLSEREVDVDDNLLAQVRNRFNVALKSIFWRKFQNNQCSDLTLRKLTESVDLDLDNCTHPLNSWEYLIAQEESKLYFLFTSWLKQFPLLSNLAQSLSFSRVNALYELVSMYIEGMRLCETQCRQKLYIESCVLNALCEEATHQRTLAQHFLDNEIRSSHPQIMAKVQTGKISQEILTYISQLLEQNHHTGLLDQQFYHQLKHHIDSCVDQLENAVVSVKDPTVDMIYDHPFFKAAPPDILSMLLSHCEEKKYQKDQIIVKSYEKPQYLYFIARGEIREEWKIPPNNFYKRTGRQMEFVCLAELNTKNLDIEYSAIATSMALLYAFPFSILRDVLTDHPKLQEILYMQMLPFVCYISPQISVKSLSVITWNRISKDTIFVRVPKVKRQTTSKRHIILLQGKIMIRSVSHGPGFYVLASEAEVVGSAKYYETDTTFEDEIQRLSSRCEKMNFIDKGAPTPL